MTIYHETNNDVEIRLPLFCFDKSQIYKLVYLYRSSTFFRNNSYHFPFRVSTNTLNGLALYAYANFFADNFANDYADQVFSAFYKYTGTDYYDYFNLLLPEEVNKHHETLVFPDDFSITESNDISASISFKVSPFTTPSKFSISYLRIHPYEGEGQGLFRVNYSYELERVWVKANSTETQTINIPLMREDSEYEGNPVRGAWIAYGSMIINAPNPIKGMLEGQLNSWESWFLYGNLTNFFNLIDNTITARFGTDLFLVPSSANVKYFYGVSRRKYTNSEYLNQGEENLLAENKNEIVTEMINQGMNPTLRDLMEIEQNQVQHFSQGIGLNNNPSTSYPHVITTNAKSPVSYDSVTWITRPSWYREGKLVTTNPVGDSLKSFRTSQVLNDVYFANNLAYFFPPAQVRKHGTVRGLYESELEDENGDKLKIALGFPTFVHPLPSHPTWLLYPPNGSPPLIDGVSYPEPSPGFRPQPMIWNGLTGSTHGMVHLFFISNSTYDSQSDTFTNKTNLITYQTDQLLPNENYNFDNDLNFPTVVNEVTIIIETYATNEETTETFLVNAESSTLNFNVFANLPLAVPLQLEQSEQDFYNYWKEKNVINTQEVLEIHAAVVGNTSSSLADNQGNLKKLDRSMLRMVDGICKVLGLSFEGGMQYVSVQPPRRFNRGETLPAGWYFHQFGINKGWKENREPIEFSKLSDIDIETQHFGIVYEEMSNQVDYDKNKGEIVGVTQGNYLLCENLIQYAIAFFNDLNNAFDIQNLSGNVINFNDQQKGTTTSLLDLLMKKFAVEADTNQTTEQTRLSSVATQQIVKEIMASIGLPVITKTFDYQLENVDRKDLVNPRTGKPVTLKVNHPAFADESSTIVDLLFMLLINIAVQNGTKITLKEDQLKELQKRNENLEN